MIIRDFYMTRDDGVKLYRSYSDQGFRIQQETGAVYDEAIDVESTTHTYTETNEPIDAGDISDTEALNILLGRDMDESS